MGEPLRKDIPQQERARPAGQFNVHRYGNPHGGGGTRWWFWILLIAVVVWFFVWGRGNGHKGAHATPVTVPATVPAPQNAVDLATLASHPEQYIGQQVLLRDVLVQSVNGDASVFVGAGATQQVLVLLKKDSVPQTLQGKAKAVPQGGVVNVSGTVRKTGTVDELEHAAKITHKQAEAVAQQGIVIEAVRVDPQPV